MNTVGSPSDPAYRSWSLATVLADIGAVAVIWKPQSPVAPLSICTQTSTSSEGKVYTNCLRFSCLSVTTIGPQSSTSVLLALALSKLSSCPLEMVILVSDQSKDVRG